MPRLVAAYYVPLVVALLFSGIDRSVGTWLVGIGLYAVGFAIVDRFVARTQRRRVGLRVAALVIPVVMLLADAGSDQRLANTQWPVTAALFGLAVGTVVALLDDARFAAVARRVAVLFGPATGSPRDDAEPSSSTVVDG